jgi:hypothetical protein
MATHTSGSSAAAKGANRPARAVDERFVWLTILAVLGLRTLIAAHRIALPGLNQDETLFVNAATLRIAGWNITSSIHGVPVMIFPYTSALKSWLYTPVFALFGTSPSSIRLPVIFLTDAGLALLYPALRNLINWPVALATVIVLSFENSVFWLTRNDVGPTAIEFFLKCAALYFASRYLLTPRLRWLTLMVAVHALGLFNKLNFIWIVNAAVAVSAWLIWYQRRLLSAHIMQLAVWVCSIVFLYALFGWYYVTQHIARLSPVVHGNLLAFTWPQFEVGMRGIISGTWFYSYALGIIGPRDAVVWIVLALFVTGAAASLLGGRTRCLAVAALAAVTLMIVMQILLTSAATAGWHYIDIYPFAVAVAAYGAYALGALFRREAGAVVALGAASAAMVIYSGVLLGSYEQDLPKAESNPGWTSAIYRLSSYVDRSGAQVYTADWGIANPLFALHTGHFVHELDFALANPSSSSRSALGRWLESIPGRKLFIAHAAGATVFPDSTTRLLAAMPGYLRLQQTVRGVNGAPAYLIYAPARR